MGSTIGHGINTFGQVVGWAYKDGSSHAFVTDNGVMLDLSSLLVSTAIGYHLDDARGINDLGQIVVYGNYNGMSQALLLTPVTAVPVQGAIWLFLSGLMCILSFNYSHVGRVRRYP